MGLRVHSWSSAGRRVVPTQGQAVISKPDQPSFRCQARELQRFPRALWAARYIYYAGIRVIEDGGRGRTARPGALTALTRQELAAQGEVKRKRRGWVFFPAVLPEAPCPEEAGYEGSRGTTRRGRGWTNRQSQAVHLGILQDSQEELPHLRPSSLGFLICKVGMLQLPSGGRGVAHRRLTSSLLLPLKAVVGLGWDRAGRK